MSLSWSRDKDTLKRQLPIAWAALQLGIQIEQHSDGSWRARCPWHADNSPSFHLWRGEDGHEKFGCYPCGVNGDVFDLIGRMRGWNNTRDFPLILDEANRFLDTITDDWADRFVTQAEEPTNSSADWPEFVASARARARSPEVDGLLASRLGLIDPELDDAERAAADRHLRDVWCLGLDDIGNLVMPHYTDRDYRLTAVKIRGWDGGKWAFGKGAKYEELYGSFIGKWTKRVLLTEGETDALWSSIAMQSSDHRLDVRALPSGVGTIKDRYIEQLKEWDEVFLALDADEAGVKGVRRLIALLGRDKVRVCILPLGKDLREARPPFDHLISNAVEPMTPPPEINFIPDQYFERNPTSQNSPPKQLTGWVAVPRARLVVGDSDEDGLEPAWELEVTHAGRKRVEVMRATDCVSSNALKKWASARGLDYRGSDTDTALLHAWFTAESVILPEVYQTGRLGIHEAPPQYSYAGRTLVLPASYVGQLPWRYVGKGANDSDVHLERGQIDWSWIGSILTMHDPPSMAAVLAWFAAATRRTEMRNFPLLYVGGPSGSGKSTIAELMCRAFGSSIGHNLSGTTPFPVYLKLGTTTTLPVFFDEYSRQSKGNALEALQGSVTFIYNGDANPRGRQDGSMVRIMCTAPVVIAGEDTLDLTREQDRMINIALSRKSQNYPVYETIADQPLWALGRRFNEYVLTAPNLPAVPTMGRVDRPTYNREVLHFGWDTLRSWLDTEQAFDPRVPELPDLDLSVLDAKTERVNEYEALLFEAWDALNPRDRMPFVWRDAHGRGTWARIGVLVPQSELFGIQLAGKQNAMIAYFESLGHRVEKLRAVPPSPDGIIPAGSRSVAAYLIHGYELKED